MVRSAASISVSWYRHTDAGQLDGDWASLSFPVRNQSPSETIIVDTYWSKIITPIKPT